MLNASVGVQRALARMRPAPSPRSSKASALHLRSLEAVRSLRDLVSRSSRQREDLAARRARLRAHADAAAQRAAAGAQGPAAETALAEPVIHRDFLSRRLAA